MGIVVTRFPLMRADPTVEPLALLAVPAEHLENRGIAVPLAPFVGRDSASSFVGLEDRASPLRPIVVDVVKSEEGKLRLSAAGALGAAVGLVDFGPDRLIVPLPPS